MANGNDRGDLLTHIAAGIGGGLTKDPNFGFKLQEERRKSRLAPLQREQTRVQTDILGEQLQFLKDKSEARKSLQEVTFLKNVDTPEELLAGLDRRKERLIEERKSTKQTDFLRDLAIKGDEKSLFSVKKHLDLVEDFATITLTGQRPQNLDAKQRLELSKITSNLAADKDLAQFKSDLAIREEQEKSKLRREELALKPGSETFSIQDGSLDGKEVKFRVSNRDPSKILDMAGNPIPSERAAKIVPKQSGNFTVETTTTPEGGTTTRIIRGKAGQGAAQRGTTTDIEKKLVSLNQARSDLARVANTFQPNFANTFDRFVGRTINTVEDFFQTDLPTIKAVAKATGVDEKTLNKGFKGAVTAFEEEVEQFFNTYRKMVTGAQASFQELERLKKSVINTSRTPAAMRAGIERLQNQIERHSILYSKLLRDAQGRGLTDDSAQFTSELESAWKNRGNPIPGGNKEQRTDAAINRGNFYRNSGYSDAETLRLLELEGFIDAAN